MALQVQASGGSETDLEFRRLLEVLTEASNCTVSRAFARTLHNCSYRRVFPLLTNLKCLFCQVTTSLSIHGGPVFS